MDPAHVVNTFNWLIDNEMIYYYVSSLKTDN